MKPLDALDRTSLEKLPKWAQDHIRHVEMRLREVSQELVSRLDSARPSDVAIERITDREHPFAFLAAGASIAFFLDNDHHKSARERQVLYVQRCYPHRCEKTGPYHLEVRTDGHNYPSVQPQAANVLRVRLSEEF